MDLPVIDIEAALEELRVKGQPDLPAALFSRMLKDAELEQARQARLRADVRPSPWRRLREAWAPLRPDLRGLLPTGALAAALVLAAFGISDPISTTGADIAADLTSGQGVVDEFEIDAHVWLTGWPPAALEPAL